MYIQAGVQYWKKLKRSKLRSKLIKPLAALEARPNVFLPQGRALTCERKNLNTMLVSLNLIPVFVNTLQILRFSPVKIPL